MVLQVMRKGASSALIKFLLFGLLLLATLGMVLMDVGGFFRNGGVGSNDVARAGRETISIGSFDHILRRNLAQLGIPPAEAYKLGLVDRILAQEIQTRLMTQAGRDLGIAVRRERVAAQVREMIAPYVQPGDNPQDVLNRMLQSQGLSERDLISGIQREMAVGLLSRTLAAAFAEPSEGLTADLYRATGEKRDIAYVILADENAAKSIPAPSDDDLGKLYELNRERFATPERRVLQLITLDAKAAEKAVTLDDATLHQSYDDNINLYTTPATRTLEQAALPDEAKARAVLEAVGKDIPMEQAVKDVIGNESAYIGSQDFEDARILKDIRKQIVAAEASALVGPDKTPLGWIVTKVVKITPAQAKPFDSVKAEIRKELMESAIADKKYEMAATLDDMLASGTSLADAAKDVPVSIETLLEIDNYGQGKDGKFALKAYEKIAQAVLETGFALGEGEVSPMGDLPDGRFAAIALKSVTAKTYTPFDTVRDSLRKQWVADHARLETRSRAATLAEKIAKGEALTDLAKAENLDVKIASNLTRSAAPAAPLTPQVLPRIFETGQNAPVVLDLGTSTAVAVVTKRRWPDMPKDGDKAYETFKNNASRGVLESALSAYIDTKNRDYGSGVNKALLDRAYGAREEAP